MPLGSAPNRIAGSAGMSLFAWGQAGASAARAKSVRARVRASPVASNARVKNTIDRIKSSCLGREYRDRARPPLFKAPRSHARTIPHAKVFSTKITNKLCRTQNSRIFGAGMAGDVKVSDEL